MRPCIPDWEFFCLVPQNLAGEQADSAPECTCARRSVDPAWAQLWPAPASLSTVLALCALAPVSDTAVTGSPLLIAMTQPTERHEFQAEVKQLLDLMVHSLYSNKDIFLRERVSNASDALDKLRFEQLTRTELSTADLHIRIEADRTKRTLTISDNGIGMTRDEVIKNIGTIARSG